MRILAIETTSALGSVALLDDTIVVAQLTESVPQRHLEWLAPAIQRLMAAAGWRPGHVEGLAVSAGPGSFTGVRIGIATAVAWARARGAPVVGVSTLAAVAMGVETSGLVCPILDARRGEVAAALFSRNRGLTSLLDDLVGRVDDVLARLPGEMITFTGEGLARYAAAVIAHRGAHAAIAPRERWAPTAVAVGRLGWERLSAGVQDDPYQLRPIYVRPPMDGFVR